MQISYQKASDILSMTYSNNPTMKTDGFHFWLYLFVVHSIFIESNRRISKELKSKLQYQSECIAEYDCQREKRTKLFCKLFEFTETGMARQITFRNMYMQFVETHDSWHATFEKVEKVNGE